MQDQNWLSFQKLPQGKVKQICCQTTDSDQSLGGTILCLKSFCYLFIELTCVQINNFACPYLKTRVSSVVRQHEKQIILMIEM